MSKSFSSGRLLKKKEVLEIIGISPATLYRWMDQEKFPRPVRLTFGTVAWFERDILEWLEKKPRETIDKSEKQLEVVRKRRRRRLYNAE